MTGQFTPLDAVVLLAYLVGATALGVRLGGSQRTARDYFVAGGTIPWWAILFSVVATETSALTFISIPGLAYLTDLSFLQVACGYLIGRVIVSAVLLPRYYQGELVTAYALLERRFGVVTRRYASIVFMVTRAFGDSVRVYATAIPVALILGPVIPQAYVSRLAILLLGLFTVVYTYYGGMRAVVWTDVLQTGVYLVGGVAAVYLIGHGVDGGWGTILSDAAARGKLHLFDTYVGLDRPHTILAGFLGGAFLSMASHGTDQLIVQRLFASNRLRDARKALIGSGIAVIVQFALFLFIGIGLFVYYGGRTFPQPDRIFPTFIIEAMPAGLTGLVVAAILAAAMSTVSGSLNALSATTTHDLWVPLTGRRSDDPSLLRTGRRFTLAWAVVLIGGALLYPANQQTPVVVVALSIASFTYGGLLGGFFLGLAVPRARQRDALIGMSVGIAAMTLVVFASPLSSAYRSLAPLLAPLARIAWPWYVLIGTAITMTVGILSSFTYRAPATAIEEAP